MQSASHVLGTALEMSQMSPCLILMQTSGVVLRLDHVKWLLVWVKYGPVLAPPSGGTYHLCLVGGRGNWDSEVQ